MGFNTTPITLEEARQLIKDSNGEVVSASKEEYFSNTDWFSNSVMAEITDDGITLYFTQVDGDFIEYCCVKQSDMTSKRGRRYNRILRKEII